MRYTAEIYSALIAVKVIIQKIKLLHCQNRFIKHHSEYPKHMFPAFPYSINVVKNKQNCKIKLIISDKFLTCKGLNGNEEANQLAKQAKINYHNGYSNTLG